MPLYLQLPVNSPVCTEMLSTRKGEENQEKFQKLALKQPESFHIVLCLYPFLSNLELNTELSLAL